MPTETKTRNDLPFKYNEKDMAVTFIKGMSLDRSIESVNATDHGLDSILDCQSYFFRYQVLSLGISKSFTYSEVLWQHSLAAFNVY